MPLPCQVHGRSNRPGAFHSRADGFNGSGFIETFSEQKSAAVVAAEWTVGCRQQVSKTGQAVEAGWLPPQPLNHNAHFRQPSAEQRGFGIGSQL